MEGGRAMAKAAHRTVAAERVQVMHLRQTERRTNEQIAAILGISKDSVATVLSSARRKLFKQIKERNKNMTDRQIISLLKRYMEGATTVEEETALAEFFRYGY